ncbi:MFS transporter [Pseudomonadota bacterium]
MKKDNVKRTVLLAVLGSISLMPLLVLPVMVGSFVDHMALSDSEAGYVASAGFLGGAIAAIFISLRIHHVDLRRMAYLGLGLMVLADGGSIAAEHMNFWLFVSLRFLSGMGGAAAYASVMGSFAGWREPDRAYGLFMAMQFAFSAVGLYGLPWVLPDTGVAGILVLFTVLDILALFLVRRLPAGPERRGAGLNATVEWRVILAATSVLCLLGIGLFEAANMANFTYADRIGILFGLKGEQIGLVLGISTMLGIPAGFGVYFVGSRFGRFRPILVAALVQIAALLLLLSGPGKAGYIVAMCLLAPCWGFALPYFQAIEARIDPGGSVVVAGGFATAFGGFLGPAIAASLVSPGDYGTMIVAAGICLFVVIGLMRVATLRLGRQ